ncbi:hypothetical protein [Lentzea sp. CA-135723]|uniref:hypothetical protein n=1 Tax=Lentzea sp. CA-135723 TaxID=3239950 RepID=UPI003D8EA92A
MINNLCRRLHDVVRAYLRGWRNLTADRSWLLDGIATLVGSPYSERNPRRWYLPLGVEYLWRWLPRHLTEAGQQAEHATLAADLRWIVKKTRVSRPLNAKEDVADVDAPPSRLAHLLGPTEPAEAVESVLLSRLQSDLSSENYPFIDIPERLA